MYETSSGRERKQTKPPKITVLCHMKIAPVSHANSSQERRPCKYAWRRPRKTIITANNAARPMARIKTGQLLLGRCTPSEHLLTRRLPLPPSRVIPSRAFHRDTGFSHVDWKPHSQRSWCRTADNTIAGNSFCSTVQAARCFHCHSPQPSHSYAPITNYTKDQCHRRLFISTSTGSNAVVFLTGLLLSWSPMKLSISSRAQGRS